MRKNEVYKWADLVCFDEHYTEDSLDWTWISQDDEDPKLFHCVWCSKALAQDGGTCDGRGENEFYRSSFTDCCKTLRIDSRKMKKLIRKEYNNVYGRN